MRAELPAAAIIAARLTAAICQAEAKVSTTASRTPPTTHPTQEVTRGTWLKASSNSLPWASGVVVPTGSEANSLVKRIASPSAPRSTNATVTATSAKAETTAKIRLTAVSGHHARLPIRTMSENRKLMGRIPLGASGLC